MMIAMIFVAIFLVFIQSTQTFKIQDEDIQNIYRSLLASPETRHLVENKKSNNDFTKLIQKIIQGVHKKQKGPTKQKRKDSIIAEKKNTYYSKKDSILNNIALKEILDRKLNILDKLNTKHFDDQFDKRFEVNELKDDLNDDHYKIFLVLDPEKTLSSSDVRDITNAVASLTAKSKIHKKAPLKDDHDWTSRYKGFVVRDNRRRRFKESKEKFAPKDSIERDYKPKRARGDYGGGGGGRTAIPYIRHRGDIYERE